MKLSIPLVKESFYKVADMPKNRLAMEAIRANFGTQIKRVSQLTKISEEIIVAMVFAESGGKRDAKSAAGAIGLMQVMPDTAVGALVTENLRKRLSDEERKAITDKIGADRANCIFSMRNMGDKRPCHQKLGRLITSKDLEDSSFNLLIGSIYLGQLIDQEAENGVIRFDRVVWRYNRGYFSKPPKGEPAKLLAAAPRETKAYILKMVGGNNLIQTLVG